MRRLAWLAEVRTLARWALAVVDPHPASSLHWTGLIITGASSAWQCPPQHASSGGEAFLHK